MRKLPAYERRDRQNSSVKVRRAGYTLVPVDLPLHAGTVKLEIGLAKGRRCTTSVRRSRTRTGSEQGRLLKERQRLAAACDGGRLSLLGWHGGGCGQCAGSGSHGSATPEVDLIGATFVAVATALGGGTIRDLLLNRNVFWIADQTYLITAILFGCAAFFILRRKAIPARWLLVPDAIGPALFTVLGTQAALQWHAPWLAAASLLGVITGVFGGVLRDVLCNEVPLLCVPESCMPQQPGWAHSY